VVGSPLFYKRWKKREGGWVMEDVKKMTVEELRAELMRIRMGRASTGARKRVEAKTKRVSESAKLKKVAEGASDADWV